jgi:ribonuclease BN (tRNA processing enzyme)
MEYSKNGINVHGPVDIFIIPHHRNRPVQPGKGFMAGGFKVLPFAVAHDVTCFGYLIEHEDMGRLVFMTDTLLSEYTFPGVNHWLVEANYSDEVLEEAVIEGRTHTAMKARLMQTHMALSTLIELFQANDMKPARNIILCHLSDSNSNADDFVRLVQETTGKPVYVADKGLNIDLSL